MSIVPKLFLILYWKNDKLWRNDDNWRLRLILWYTSVKTFPMPSARKQTFMLISCTSWFKNYLCMCSDLKHFAASLLLMQHSHCGAERQTVCVGLMLTFDTETTALWLEQWQFQSVQSLLQHQHRLFLHNCTEEWGGGIFRHIQTLHGTPSGTCKLTKSRN